MGIDGKRNPIGKEDNVKIINGHYKGKKGIIKNIYRNFAFMYNSDFVITVDYDKFKETIDNIFNQYIKTEQYELCDRVKKLEKKLLCIKLHNLSGKKTYSSFLIAATSLTSPF